MNQKWKSKPYWIIADDLSYNAYSNISKQIQSRGTYTHTEIVPLDLDYSNTKIENNMCIEYKHTILSSDNVQEPDNLGYCLSCEDYAEIEIITVLPKGYKIKTLLNNKSYHFDLLNVIRHEIEHVFQSKSFKIDNILHKRCKRSKRNFLLKKCEITAYAHGFRISTRSRDHFLESIKEFIALHGKNLKLSDKEIEKTISVWYDYITKLKYH